MKIFTALVLTLCFLSSCSSGSSEETLVYFGTYTKKDSKGIYVSKLNTETGALTTPVLAAEIANPSFVAVHPSKRYLYAVVENAGNEAVVVSFSINADGSLTKINEKPAKGDHPCHVSVDSTGRTLLITNYSGGNCASFPITADGSIGAGTYYKHIGSSVNKNRQKAPHPHSVNIDPANKRAFVADLGIDKIMIYNLDSKAGKLSNSSFIKLPAGGGPRHLSFHPSGRYAYSNLELTREVVAMSYDSETGTLKKLSTYSTLPEGAKAEGSTAECLVHPSGKFLYVSNRGHNSIAVFRIDQLNGLLNLVEVESTKGTTPRGFGIDPSGHFIVVGHQNSDDVNVFRINQMTGALTDTGNTVNVNMAVNVRFLKK